jgi:hypothetical protein
MTSLVAVAETPFIPQSMADDMSLAMLSAVYRDSVFANSPNS